MARRPLVRFHLGLAVALGALAAACGDPRQAVTGTPITGAAQCASCHGFPPAKDAHLAHAVGVSGASGVPHAAIACFHCHQDIQAVSDVGHIYDADGKPVPPPARVGFDDPRAIAARTEVGGTRAAAPVYDPVTRTCSNVYCHGATLKGPTADLIAAPRWDAPAGTIACGRCHGIPPTDHPPGLAVTDCNVCHGAAIDKAGVLTQATHVNGAVDLVPNVRTSCATCHGDRTAAVLPNDPRSAPPTDAEGRPASDPAATGIGAHQAHVRTAADGVPRLAIACFQCHKDVQDVNDPEHVVPGRNNVRFDDPRALAVKTQPGATRAGPPSFNPTSRTCSNVYCHGAGLKGPTPAVVAVPTWNAPAGAVACGGCHGIPPAGHAEGLTVTACTRCHGDAIDAAGVPSATKHLDGKVDLAAAGATACASCHGDRTAGVLANDPRSAPPSDARGRPASDPAATGIGAHQAHAVTGAGVPRLAIACFQCHKDVQALDDPEHVVPGRSNVRFDDARALASRTQPGATRAGPPAYDPATQTCSNVYCHGSGLKAATAGVVAAPAWGAPAGSSACGKCHGIPPADHDPGYAVTGCTLCHGDAIDATGAPSPTKHMNGAVELVTNVTTSCAACHGDGSPGVPPGDARGAPPTDASGQAASPAVGAHQAHLVAGTLGVAVACSECHVVPSSIFATGHIDGRVTVAFGALARATGAAPAYAAGTQTCSSVYCHGSFPFSKATPPVAPTWNGGQAAVACGSCHDLPPPAPGHLLVDVPTQGCGVSKFPGLACHPAPYSPTAVDPKLHIDGKVCPPFCGP